MFTYHHHLAQSRRPRRAIVVGEKSSPVGTFPAILFDRGGEVSGGSPPNKYVNAQQMLVYHQDRENEVVRWFRQMYRIVADAYDDRPEVEKEIWDLHKMGLEVNMAGTAHHLNFTRISQPWFRDLVKEYMRYNLAVHSPGDCVSKLTALNAFSHFLAQYHPHLGVAGLDRALMVEYIGYLRDRQVSESWICTTLVTLRTLLETGAYRLGRHDLPKERLIFDDDLPKEKKTLPREIPEEVVAQIREHLEPLHHIHGFQISFERPSFARMRFILQASKLFFSPASECRMHGLPRGAQIFRDRLRHPSISMQPDDHAAPLCRVAHLIKAGKPASGA